MKNLLKIVQQFAYVPGQKIDFWVLQGLLQTSELGNEKYLNSVMERLVEGEK